MALVLYLAAFHDPKTPRQEPSFANMLQKMKTILIIGATSGIGEGFARRFHSMGKRVVITGRREERLSALAKELPGLQTRQV